MVPSIGPTFGHIANIHSGWWWYSWWRLGSFRFYGLYWPLLAECIPQTPKCFSLASFPVPPQLRKLWFLRYVCVCVGGRVFDHGRMSVDGNKLQKVFQGVISKAGCLIMMMSWWGRWSILNRWRGVREVTPPHSDGSHRYRGGTWRKSDTAGA